MTSKRNDVFERSILPPQTNVNRFLGQHTSVELTDDTVTTEPSGPEPDKSQVEVVKPQPRSSAREVTDERKSFDNVVAHTKKQLMKMGVNVDRLNAAEKSYRWVGMRVYTQAVITVIARTLCADIYG